MDGFGSSTKVIVIGATNRPEVLDPALLRPGRFDRRVAVQPPDRNGRRQILEVHTRGVPLAPDADLDVIAASTPGMVGADLANVVNEATLLAARRNHPQVTEADFSDALEKIVLGTERKVLMTPADRRRTAYHEGGHALVGMLTQIARHMVGRWGMNATIGPVAVLPQDGWPRPDDVSEETQRLVDEEVRKLVAAAHDGVTRLLVEHRDQLDRLADALLEHETRDQGDAYAAAGVTVRRAETTGAMAVAALSIGERR